MSKTIYYKTQVRWCRDFYLISSSSNECVKVKHKDFDFCTSRSVPDDVGYTSRHSGTDVSFSICDKKKVIHIMNRRRTIISEDDFNIAFEKAKKRYCETINETSQSSANDDLGGIIRAEYNADHQ